MMTRETARQPWLRLWTFSTGSVIGRCMKLHRHQEFVRFLAAVERAAPAG
jgi:hypothetical protein